MLKSMKIFNKKDVQFENVNAFLNQSYQTHNISRLAHLETLGLNFYNKRVLEIGAGIGDHTYYYLIKGAQVTSSDARPELIEFIKNRFGNNCFVFDAEKELGKIITFPQYDIIHCYGLLYHINNPESFLNSLNKITRLLLLETCVSHDYREDGPHLIKEDASNPTQAFSGTGCRPTRHWIYTILKNNFKFIYFPKTQPQHYEFPKDWTVPMEDRNSLIRAVFIASQDELQSEMLSNQLPKKYIDQS